MAGAKAAGVRAVVARATEAEATAGATAAGVRAVVARAMEVEATAEATATVLDGSM